MQGARRASGRRVWRPTAVIGPVATHPAHRTTHRTIRAPQVRPNQTRADLGYVEPSEGKKRRRDTADDDGAGPSGESGGVGIGGGGGGSSSSRIPFGLTVDFCKLDMAALKRYKRHYRLKVRPNVTKGELANAVARHFASQTVDEADTISLFMCAPRPPPHRSHRAAPLCSPLLHPLHPQVYGSRDRLRARTSSSGVGLTATIEVGTTPILVFMIYSRLYSR